jgi:hypothetical protein
LAVLTYWALIDQPRKELAPGGFPGAQVGPNVRTEPKLPIVYDDMLRFIIGKQRSFVENKKKREHIPDPIGLKLLSFASLVGPA